MQVTYIFHSCFIVETLHHILVFDYYKGNLPAFDAKKHIIFFVSHIHQDHFHRSIWNYANQYPKVSYIIDKAIYLEDNVEGLQVSGNQDYQYQDVKIHTLTSTDEGVAFYIEVDDNVIYHAGDLNWWHWEGEPQKDNDWQDQMFHQEIAYLKNKTLDIAFLPLDPRLEQQAWWGFYDVLKLCNIKYVFPMHFGKDIKKMQEYLHQSEVQPYIKNIVCIEHQNQSFACEDK